MISTNRDPAVEEMKSPISGGLGWAAVLVWVSVIFFSSTSLASKWAEAGFQFLSGPFFQNAGPDDSSFTLFHLLADKGFHVTLFAILGMLLWLVLPAVAHRSWLIVVCGAVVGSCSEFLQRFFPDRDPALRDVIINIAGTALGVLIAFLVRRVFRREPKLRSSSR